MPIYRSDVRCYASLYIRAASEEEAVAIAKDCNLDTLNLVSGEIEVSELSFDDPDLPDLSASPVITIPLDGTEEAIEEVEE